MVRVSRRVREAAESDGVLVENPVKPIKAFRDQPAWVLLGEPGAGKTEIFKLEAESVGGERVDIAEFIHTVEIDVWYGKTLFLDGLDEIRAGFGDESALVRVVAQLKRLGCPPFRIACRAADWFGSTDEQEIEKASPDGEVKKLFLEPLSDEDILAILENNHGIADPAAFVENARKQGVAHLLGNPQTLGLLAQAIRGEQWPTTRQEVFQLACQKLAEEANKRHRDKRRFQPVSVEKLLDAAGELCAVLLLSDQDGLALDPESARERYPCVADCVPSDNAAAVEAVRTKLFRPVGEERFVPSHRSIAEYLAARWLGACIDRFGLPLGRVLNLLLGVDGRTVAGLRGLFAWLAFHSGAARRYLIDTDPVSVVFYGDAKPLSREDKRRILVGLRWEAEHHTAFLRDSRYTHPLGALADPALTDDFIAALETPARDDVNQAYADGVLAILAEGDAIPGLAPSLRKVVVDNTWWGAVRKSALKAWLQLPAVTDEAVSLLEAIFSGGVSDFDDELTGILLCFLYPEYLAPESLMRYLHVPKDRRLLGSYIVFWEHELPAKVPESHLPILLDHLAERKELPARVEGVFHFHRMTESLLARALEQLGDNIADERVFAWLGIGTDEIGSVDTYGSERDAIVRWLETHPERYKALLLVCFEQCEDAEDPRYCVFKHARRLRDAQAPDDIGLWHLQRASMTASDALAQEHLDSALLTLVHQRGNRGLSLGQVEAWGERNPDRKRLLENLLVCNIPDWRAEQAARTAKQREVLSERRRVRTIQVGRHLEKIRQGTANPALMHQLAGVWKQRYADIPGESVSERFNNYCENGQAVQVAAESGFIRCVERDDLPVVDEIIRLHTKHREHYIRLPCLIGMDLRWQQGLQSINSLSEDVLRRMLAFRLTYAAEETPPWFRHLVDSRPDLVAAVLIDYASASFKLRHSHIDAIYPLEHDPRFEQVARLAVPELLKRFPVRARSDRLHYLQNLLKAGLRYCADKLPGLVKKKVGLKSMDVAQKVYWLAVGMQIDPRQYEPTLWHYIGNNWIRANYLSAFARKGLNGIGGDYTLSPTTIGRLLELMAPHAELEWSSDDDWSSDAVQRGEHVRALVTQLGALGTDEASREIERLLGLPALQKLKIALENARHQLRLKQRERDFRFLRPAAVADVLANRAPVSTADLAALVLDHWDDIAREIRKENDDGFRAFWNLKRKAPVAPREENDCRDVLLYRLRARLGPQGIDCQPEADSANDKRADIRISFRNAFELPIEIKRDTNKALWSGLQTQLVGQYAIAPKASGYGLYLVLWFGGGGTAPASDGGKKPRSPDELQARLEALLDPADRGRIFIRVLDVSWPPTGGGAGKSCTLDAGPPLTSNNS